MATPMYLLQFVLSIVLGLGAPDTSIRVKGLDGSWFEPFRVNRTAGVLFFLSTECPISRFYAPEIQGICSLYTARGVRCSLVFEDVSVAASTIQNHLREFGYRGIPAATDKSSVIAKESGVVVTPEAVVIDSSGRIRYRGRIDDFYADLGKPRRQARSHELKDALDAILTGRRVDVPETKAVGCFITSTEILNRLNP
jgi:hypothetical protein